MIARLLSQHIVGRSQLYHAALIPYEQMAVAGSHIEMIGIIFQFLPNCVQQNRRVLGTDFAGAVIDNRLFFIRLIAVGYGNQVGPKGDIVGLHIHADA